MKDKSIILVVDDHSQNTELLEAHLVPQGYEVVKAASGEEALKILSCNQIDLVLLDVMMPGMSGFEVLEKMRADKKTRLIPVIMVTVLKETEDRIKALEAGCDDFISKPFDRHVLLARVKSLLRIKSLHDEVEETRQFVERIINTVREPLIILDQNLKVVTVSRSFYDFFNVKSEETVGQIIYDLGNGQWDIPQLRELLEKILPLNSVFNNFEVEHEFESIGPKIMHLNARKIHRKKNHEQLILLAMEDVTERESFKRNLEIIVEERTAELALARQEAEKGREVAETSLSEIKTLKKQLEGEKAYLNEEIKLEHNHENIIGKSDALKYVLYKVGQIAAINTTVLVLGETGTGKELVARAVHHGSPRKNRALVKINCAALPSNLIESELFGHEKGAYTGSTSRQLGRFEIADGATLFLDEIGELPLELQPKLLRVIQDGEFERLGSSRTIKVDARIIAATNRNLEEEVQKGRFREDLFYRLNVFPITMPPLRDRMEDVPLLVAYYVKKISKRLGKTNAMVPQIMMETLMNYHWPGNVRELENILERAVIISSGPKLHMADDFNKSFEHSSKCEKTLGVKTLEEVEREYIVRVLEQTHWKVSGKNSTAQILGLNRSTLRARMRKLDICKPDKSISLVDLKYS